VPVISEEIDMGNIGEGGKITSSEVRASVETVSTAQSPVGSSPSIEDLDVVTKILEKGVCVDADEVAHTSGLPKQTVVFCLEWLVSKGLVSQDAARYCGLSSVKRMCEQLKGCKACL